MLVGLLTRVAAVAGMALSFGLFLTVSFHSSPYFTGSDIVFFFAWTPLALAGAAGAPALDTWMPPGNRRRPVRRVALPRRTVLSKGAVTGLVAAAVVVAGGAGRRRSAGCVGGTSSLGRPSGHPHRRRRRHDHHADAAGDHLDHRTVGHRHPPYGHRHRAGLRACRSGDRPASPIPASGDPALVIQQNAGEFVAFDAVCPHAGLHGGLPAVGQDHRLPVPRVGVQRPDRCGASAGRPPPG